ncbi:unnamed protein product [Linum trigynum]|uniref:Uncharacterized protein n=1 Tax=Linum trigynum TaxID=586398 RepID=A0AAV2ERY8_9ROSI
MDDKVQSFNVMDTLWARHVLRRVDAYVGVRKLYNAQGGVATAARKSNLNTKSDLAMLNRTIAISKDKGKRKLEAWIKGGTSKLQAEIAKSKEKLTPGDSTKINPRPTTVGKSIRIRERNVESPPLEIEQELEEPEEEGT